MKTKEKPIDQKVVNRPRSPEEGQRYASICNKFRENLKLLLESVSIRGCNRIFRAPTRAIRLLWIFFLVFTSLFLLVSVFRLIKEYLNYSVNIQTRIAMDQPSNFPSVTFCNHQPFSAEAYRQWSTGNIMSPSDFSRSLRQKAVKIMGSAYGNSMIQTEQALQFGIVSDSVKVYYQNLQWPQQRLLGHERNQSIYLCLFRYTGHTLALGGRGCHDAMVSIVLISNPHYFNCHTVEIVVYRKEIEELGLIIWLGPDEDHDVRFRQAFLHDLFEQAYGVRMVIHEPNQLADLQSGTQIKPGRFNELTFEAVRTIHKETPRKPCIADPKTEYMDLDQTYAYDFELCLNTYLQRIVVERCSCMYAYLPRIILPSDRIPYCGKLLFLGNQSIDKGGNLDRISCVRNVLKQSAVLKKGFEDSRKCLRRCTVVEYRGTVSATNWRTTNWQLAWSQEIADALEHGPDTERTMAYFNAVNLSSSLPSNRSLDGLTGHTGFSDRYTYVVIKRKSNDTVINEEHLVLTLNALVSRIGGLCSLYIGMTFAVIIELIEFFYVALIHKTPSNNHVSNEPPLLSQEVGVPSSGEDSLLAINNSIVSPKTDIDQPTDRSI